MKLNKQWLAGFLDGEGSFGICRRKQFNGKKLDGRYYYMPFVAVSQAGKENLWILKELKNEFGEGIYDYKRSNWSSKWKPAWKWSITNSRAVEFSQWIKDDLLVKKQQAEILAQYPLFLRAGHTRTDEECQAQEEAYQKLKKLNQRGIATAEA